MSIPRITFTPLFALLIFILLAMPVFSIASTAEELRSKIGAHNDQITALEAEIAQYQKQLNETSAEKQTLQGTLNALDISRKKTNAKVKVAQNQISATTLQIRQLGGNIKNKEELIESGNSGLAESIRSLHESEDESLAISILKSGSLSNIWDDANTLMQFQDRVSGQVKVLASAKVDLEEAKVATERKQAELIAHRNELRAQQRALDINRQQQAKLLTETKNKESNYQSIISKKKAAKAKFESELTEFESQLKYTLDPKSIPSTGKGIFNWPLRNIRITQYFGKTAFANAGAYNGNGHNGMDFGSSIGTPLHAVLSGTIEGTGNTDQYKGCYSYGKWILIRHTNGLSTLYAHLSQIDVRVGQRVSTDQVIGFTGFTGYATGPHLHFSVYVSDAVQIVKLGTVKSRTNCAQADIPIAPLNAYLNPMDYLPSL